MNDIIKKYEGFSAKPYLCPAGVWTIGYGSTTYSDGRKVSEKDHAISRDTANALLLNYVINEIYPHLRDMDITENQKTALTSLIYNIGWPAFAKSKCYKAILKKEWETVFANWDWIKAGKKALPGLIKRREEERCLFFLDI